MKKTELLQKKGLTGEIQKQNPSAALIITNKNDTEVNSNEKIKQPVKQNNKQEKQSVEPVVKEINKTTKTTNKGRPKGLETRKISMNIPCEMIDYINIAAAVNFKGNTSGYIISLIERDMKKNEMLYKQIKELSKKN